MSALNGRSVLVFGGAGFIGRHLTERLISLGARVSVFDRSAPDIPGANYLPGDFSDADAVRQAIAGHHYVYHLVSTTQPASSNADPVYDIQSNLLPSIAMLQAAVAHKINKIVFVSSGGTVYGVPRQVPISESHPTDPICSYGIGKLAIEKYLQLFNRLHNLDYIILRMSNPYGPGQKAGTGQGVVAEFVSRVQRGESLELYGDGSVVRDFIYISDAVDALVAAVERPVSGIFNIGSGVGVSISELITVIRQISQRHIEVKQRVGRPFDVPSNVLSIELARQLLGWRPEVGLTDGIAEILAMPPGQ